MNWRVTLAVLALAACTPADQDALAREAARSTVTPLIEARFPGVPVGPVVNCVIDNATAPEILTLAAASVTGVTPEATRVTNAILARPGTQRCVAERAIQGVLTGGLG